MNFVTEDITAAIATLAPFMPLTYYDSREARNRIKPRYVWGFWAFLSGVATGIVLVQVLF